MLSPLWFELSFLPHWALFSCLRPRFFKFMDLQRCPRTHFMYCSRYLLSLSPRPCRRFSSPTRDVVRSAMIELRVLNVCRLNYAVWCAGIGPLISCGGRNSRLCINLRKKEWEMRGCIASFQRKLRWSRKFSQKNSRYLWDYLIWKTNVEKSFGKFPCFPLIQSSSFLKYIPLSSPLHIIYSWEESPWNSH